MKVKTLTTPLTEKVVRGLHVGDVVMLDGHIFTGRESFYMRAAEQSILPDIDYDRCNVQMHVGPVIDETPNGFRVVGLTPTGSIRMERYAAGLVERLGTRALIGKGAMAEKTLRAMCQVGCVHLSNIGIIPCALAHSITKVLDVHFLQEIGPTEATWVFEVNQFGPFLVDMDTHGQIYQDRIRENAERLRPEVLRRLGVSKDFTYTPI